MQTDRHFYLTYFNFKHSLNHLTKQLTIKISYNFSLILHDYFHNLKSDYLLSFLLSNSLLAVTSVLLKLQNLVLLFFIITIFKLFCVL